MIRRLLRRLRPGRAERTFVFPPPRYLVFQDAFSGQQLAYGPGELADLEGPSLIVVLSTAHLAEAMSVVH